MIRGERDEWEGTVKPPLVLGRLRGSEGPGYAVCMTVTVRGALQGRFGRAREAALHPWEQQGVRGGCGILGA